MSAPTRAPKEMSQVAAYLRNRRLLACDLEVLRKHQVASLTRVLDAAMRSEPYRRLYGSPPRVTSLEDLGAMPVIDRSYLARFSIEERLTHHPPDLERAPSTGTTGEVMLTLRAPEENEYQWGLLGRQFEVQGISPGARHLSLLFQLRPDEALQVRGNVGHFPAWAPAEKQAEIVRSFKPSFISGPASCLLELGDYIGEFKVDSMMTFAEVVTSEDRKELRRHFGADPLDLYGASETGFISWECPQRAGYHINADAVIVEVLDGDDQPVPLGEVGNLVITTLWNPTMPVIRYRIRDVGNLLPGTCSCGVTLPLMGPVVGREQDFVIAHDGRRISPLRFVLGRVGPYWTDVKRIHVVQREVDDFLVEVVWREDPIPHLAAEMAHTYSEICGGPVRVELRSVDRLSTTPGRKFRWLESRVT